MIQHYFSKDPSKKAKFIFNLIAPIYNKIDNYLDEDFTSAIKILANEIDLKDKSIIDLGCGTGAWGSRFSKFNVLNITGVDFSERMLKVARGKHKKISFLLGDAENLIDFKDKSFNISTASYVLHGVKKERRRKILNEMSRISKKYIVIHDFYGKTPFFTRVLEFLEGSDYKYFKKHFKTEMEEIFSEVKVLVLKDTALYIGIK